MRVLNVQLRTIGVVGKYLRRILSCEFDSVAQIKVITSIPLIAEAYDCRTVGAVRRVVTSALTYRDFSNHFSIGIDIAALCGNLSSPISNFPNKYVGGGAVIHICGLYLAIFAQSLEKV